MATMNSGPGARLTRAAGIEDSYAVGFMRRAPKGLTAFRIDVSSPRRRELSPDYTLAAEPLRHLWRVAGPCLTLPSTQEKSDHATLANLFLAGCNKHDGFIIAQFLEVAKLSGSGH